MESILINQIGLDFIAAALEQHQKFDVTQDMINAYASDAENGWDVGQACCFEIAASRSLTGQPVVVEIPREGFDIHDYDEEADEDTIKSHYYVVVTRYVGPNQDRHIDADRVEIRTAPARGNMDHQIILDGWCGTTNDWAVFAHGQFETLESAEAFIRSEWEVRESGEDEYPFGYDDDVVAAYKFGKYIPMDAEGTGNWAAEAVKLDVTADTTDEEIDALIAGYESDVNGEGYTLDKRSLEDWMIDRRDELREERKAGIEIESMEWSDELEGFVCTLADGRVVQVQFEKNTHVLDAGCGDYYPVLDTQNEYGLDLSDDEREAFMDLIRDDETVLEKAKAL